MDAFPPTLLQVILIVLGPAIGSFVCLAADRLGTRQGLWGRSTCAGCGAGIPARDLIPMISWLALSGRARCCGVPLAVRLLIAEIAGLAVALWAVWQTDGWVMAVSTILGWTLLWLTLTDLAHFRLPDMGTLPLVVAGLALAAIGLTGALWLHALGALLGYGVLAGIAWAYRWLRAREGLGLGDAKLLAAAGAWLGAGALPSVLLIGCIAALVHAVVATRGHLSASAAVPFGPGLCLGFWVTWLHGPLVLG